MAKLQDLKNACNRGQDVAVAIVNNTAYYVYWYYEPTSPYSVGSVLIQNLCERFAGRFNDTKLYTTERITTLTAGMSKLAGFRWERLDDFPNVEFDAHEQIFGDDWWTRDQLRKFDMADAKINGVMNPGLNIICKENRPVHRIYMMAAFALILNRSTACSTSAGQPISAILVDKSGRILSWAVNDNSSNLTFHAEVNMLQSWYKQFNGNNTRLPEGCIIYTTLKPCKMCAAMIQRMSYKSKGSLSIGRIFIGQHDPGGLASGTALDENPYNNLQWHLNKDFDDDFSKIKPIHLPGDKMGNLGQALQNAYANADTDPDNKYPITAFLKDASGMMSQAVTQLKSKQTKYTSPPVEGRKYNPNVQRAVAHVTAFLADRGVNRL